ncbi:hypothetical protein [Lentzea nigeriaca]|uniref:hypothetical protein n=1 Tax=Lentzea nigeriaca TaxID=1128665 RepID=UPI00195E4091|nr:hypothetical protein [Lentzea nigeriaca]MBM7861785.1 hypothetical protein [Lentzea nigeriaca]
MPRAQATPETLSARGTLARRTALFGPDDPRTEQARAAFRSERYLAAVAASVAAAPPLTAEQRSRLAAILKPVVTVAIGSEVAA